MKSITLDLIQLLKTEYGVNALGEILRCIFFSQKKGFGCYETFELNPDVKPLPNEVDHLEENKDITYTCAEWNGIKMRYYWDGDGYLEFELDEDGRAIYNDDCKKDHGWEYTH